MTPEVWMIRDRWNESHDTFSIQISPQTHRRPLVFLPGQFNMIYVPGFGEIAISISGDAREDQHLIHTIRKVGPATHALAQLRKGDSLGIRGPFGTPWAVDQCLDRHVVLIAGGIGLAPLRPVIYALAHQAQIRHEEGLSTTLYYGARTPEDQIYTDELKKWAKLPGFHVFTTVDHATREWNGNVGVVTQLMHRPIEEPSRTLAFTCGPETMMRFVARKLMDLSLPIAHISVSAERNMKCAIGHCGHCQYGPHFICKDGPVFNYDRIRSLMETREL